MARLKSVKELREALKSGKTGDILDWTGDGSIVGFLDPRSGVEVRHVHWVRVYEEVEETDAKTKQKRKVLKVVARSRVCPNDGDKKADKCDICRLRRLLKENDEIDLNEIVLVVGEGKEQLQYSKGDIIGEDGFDWKQDLRYNKEYLAGFMPVDKEGKPLKDKPQILIMPKTLGKAVLGVIDEQIDEEGEEKGDPFQNPYAIKLKYDSEAPAASKYDAVANKAPYTEALQAIFSKEDTELDLSKMAEFAEADVIRKSLQPYLQINIPGLGFEAGEGAAEAPKPRKTAESLVGKKPALPAKPAARKPAEETDEEPFGAPAEEEEQEEQETAAEETDEPAPEEEDEPAPAPAPAKPVAPKPSAPGKAPAPPAKPPVPGKTAPAAPAKPAPAPAKPAGTKVVKTAAKPAAPAEPESVTAAREAGEQLDMCPLCNREVPASATKCPWDGCTAEFAEEGETPFE